MIKLIGSCKEFDDYWNNDVVIVFDEISEVIDELDLSDKTKEHTKAILEKDINRLYDKLDGIFYNSWKYLVRSEEGGNNE